MNFSTRLKALLMRTFFDRVVMRKPAYPIDGVPPDAVDTRVRIPTAQGETYALIHQPPGATAGDAPRPAVVLFHGGGFVFGLPQHEAAFCRRLASELNCIVVNPAYALSPEHSFPTAVHQCYEIVAWVARQARSLGIDSQRLAVGGHSAGGNLATGVVNQAVAKGFPHICYQLLDYPFLDATVAPEDKHSPIANPLIEPKLANLFNSCYIPADTALDHYLLSPVYTPQSLLARHPPTLVITAEHDTLRAEAEHYADRLRQAGVAVEHRRFSGVDHAFTHNGPKAAADEAWQLMAERLRQAFQTASNDATAAIRAVG